MSPSMLTYLYRIEVYITISYKGKQYAERA